MDNKLKIILNCLLEKKGKDIVYCDISKRNPLANYLIIATANGAHHAYSLANNIKSECAKNSIDVVAVEGKNGSEWILVDAYDYLINIFTPEGRFKFALEKLYSYLKLIKVSDE